MGDRFALAKFDPLGVQGSFLPMDGTGEPAVGTRLLVAEGTLQKGLEGALGEPLGGGVGDLLHRVEIDTESGAVVAERAAGDDFPPLGGEVAEFPEFVGGERTRAMMRPAKGFR